MTESYALVLLGSALGAVATLLRKLVLLDRIGRNPYGSDVYDYLLLVRNLRGSGRRWSHGSPGYIGADPVHYRHPLIPWLASFLEPSWLARYHWLPSIAAKVLVAGVIGGVGGGVLVVLGAAGPPLACGAFLAALSYGFSPINANVNPSNSSDFNFGPRPWGALFSGPAVLALVWAAGVGGPLALVVAAAVTVPAFLVSKFAVQSVVFVGMGYSLWTGQWEGLLVLILGMVMAGIVSMGVFWRATWLHVERFPQAALRTSWTNSGFLTSALTTLNLPRIFWRLFRGDVNTVIDIVGRDVTIRAFVFYPIHMLCAAVLISQYAWWHQEPILHSLAVVWIVTAIVMLLTSLPVLRFIGEGDRYMEYVGIYPATAIGIAWLASGPMSALSALAILASILAFGWLIEEVFGAIGDKTERFDHTELCFALKRELPEAARLLTVPATVASYVVYETGIACFYPTPVVGRKKVLWNRFPIPLLDVSRLRDEFHISHILVRNDYLEDPEVVEALKACKHVLDVAQFSLWNLTPDGATTNSYAKDESRSNRVPAAPV